MYEYDFNTYSIRRKRSKKRFFFLVGFISLFIIFFAFILPDGKEKKKNSADIASSKREEVLAKQTNITENPLNGIISNALVNTNGTYAVVVINPKTGEKYFLNEHRKFDAASLYKLWVMAVVYQQIEEGTLEEDTSLNVDIEELNKKFHIASESAELAEGTMSFTVASALRQMITISHNYAALALTERVRLSTVEKFLVSNGFRESRVGSANSLPVTTAADVALFFEKLLKGELANKENTKKMIDLLKAQRLNNKLPRNLPGNAVIAHKTGELGLFTHDAGIVYLPGGGEYIIAVLSESVYPPGAEERIGQISQSVYRYFMR